MLEGFVDHNKIREAQFDVILTEMKADYQHEYDVIFVQWNRSLGQEYSKFYFIDSNNKERYKEATRLNKKSDEF